MPFCAWQMASMKAYRIVVAWQVGGAGREVCRTVISPGWTDGGRVERTPW